MTAGSRLTYYPLVIVPVEMVNNILSCSTTDDDLVL